MAFEQIDKDVAWRVIIEECFEETHDEKMVEVNPVTNMYPFILAAAGDTSELNTLFYLLRRNPVYRTGRVM